MPTKPVLNKLVPRAKLLDATIGVEAIERRLGRIDEPHIAPLTEWVRDRQDDPRLPSNAGRTIPWMDPDSGGVDSRVLLLLQDPSRTATDTRFISPDNNDSTARCTTDACQQGGLDRSNRLHWNVYPWWVNTKDKGAPRDPSRPPDTWANASRVAALLWGDFFRLLPELRVIVTFGKRTREGWSDAVAEGLRVPTGVDVRHAGSLSPLGGYYRHRDEVTTVIADVARSARAVTRDNGTERGRGRVT